MRAIGSVLVPMLGGALVAAAAGLLLGSWPGLPPITGIAPSVAAYALVVTPMLLVVAAGHTASVPAGEQPWTVAPLSPLLHTAGVPGGVPQLATSVRPMTIGPPPVTWTYAVPSAWSTTAAQEHRPSTMLDDPYGPIRLAM